MNAQLVYETWKKIAMSNKNAVFPTEADEYVRGDDSKYDKIPKRVLWMWEYPKVLVEELDGEGGEMAVRCLRSIYRMKNGVAVNESELKTMKRIGLTVLDLLEDGLTDSLGMYSNAAIMGTARTIYAYMDEDCEKYITADYLEKRLANAKHNVRTLHLAFCIASLLAKDGRGDVKKLIEKLLSYSERVETDTAALVMRETYKCDKRCESKLKELMRSPDNIHVLWCSLAKGLQDTAKEIGAEDYFTYAALTGKIGAEMRSEAVEKVVQSPDKLLPWMYEAAVSRASGIKDIAEQTKQTLIDVLSDMFGKKTADEKKNRASIKRTDELCAMAQPLAIALKNGNASELLSLYERHYTDMLVFMSDFFCIDKENSSVMNNINAGIAAAHEIYKNPEEAAKIIRYDSCRTSSRYYTFSVVKALSVLFDYSENAAKIVYALVKSGEYHGNLNNCDRLAELISVFCLEREQVLGCSVQESMELLFKRGISLETYFTCCVVSCDFYNSDYNFAYRCVPQYVKDNMPAAIDFYGKVKNNAKSAAFWAEILYKKSGCTDVDLLMEMMKNKSKNVRKVASDVISAGEDSFRAPLEAMVPKLKGDALVQAQGIIKKWDNNKKYGKNFELSTNILAEEYVSENTNPAAVKKTAFIPDEYFDDVRFADMNGIASTELVRHIIGEYFCLSEPYRITVCDKLAAKLYTPDLQACLENIYQYWLENGADNKTKVIMVPYCIYASDTQILALKKQIASWAEAQRGALGAYVINAVAINGGSTALMMVNDISAKFPHNQVKKAAKAAFSYAAKALGLPEDVLADKIVPNLGLDKNGEIVLDYGARTVTVSLMPDFTLSFFDNEKQKTVKSLPKPSANDDAVKAEEAKKYVSELKKQLKAVTAVQKTRLEAVFRNGRTWTSEAWNTLFVDNPVMHRFAGTLVWGAYKDGKLEATFRYTDDGSFCDENDDIFEIPDGAEISLVHPFELEADTVEAWLEQLSDYEIVQPFAQISARVIKLEAEDIDDKQYIKKYNGRSFTVSSMNNAAKKYNFVRSSVEDGGGFSGYHIQDRVLGIGVKFGFENMYMGQDYSESVDLTDVYFYRLPEEDEQPDSYSEYEAIPPSQVSERFISCCLNILETILD
ncbi:MAG: DUF4132 domain-containing protein [Oscillospiraceae bacterium]|nr:DUF4132 domain-containing protein [Oscillospiraceae bacterium]